MEKSISLHSLSSYKPYGINVLTGEACSYSLRLLCDLTKQGKEYITEFFGAMDLSLPENWNSGSVCAIMLPRSIFTDLGAFILLKQGYHVIVQNNSITGVSPEKENLLNDWVKSLRKMKEDFRYIYNKQAGDRNTHQMSGRTL